ncbi:glycosyl transferase family 28, partial [Streptomyces sp. NPDC020801]
MRVLFTTFATKAHFNTQVPLAWALRAAGHEVCVASQPDLAQYIMGTGLTAVPVGPPLNLDSQMEGFNQRREEAERADSHSPEALDFLDLTDMSELRLEKLTYDFMQTRLTVKTMSDFQVLCPDSMVDDLVGFAKWWRPDLVVWDTMTFAGPVAAIASGAAHAR